MESHIKNFFATLDSMHYIYNRFKKINKNVLH